MENLHFSVENILRAAVQWCAGPLVAFRPGFGPNLHACAPCFLPDLLQMQVPRAEQVKESDRARELASGD